MARWRLLPTLVVYLVLAVSSPIGADESSGLDGDDTIELLQANTLPPLAAATPATPATSATVQASSPATVAVAPGALQAATVSKPVQVTPLVTKVGPSTHDSAWHCSHCSSTCTTPKCTSWCQQRWCSGAGSGGSPMFLSTSLHVPAKAGNNWHCSHCNAQCKTSKCQTWCKRLWCALDADGNPMGWSDLHGTGAKHHHLFSARIRGGKNQMKLLSISKHGSPKLVDMETSANSIISRCNQDTTGMYLQAAFKAVDSVIAQRDQEKGLFKEAETKANEADKKRYDKQKYQKWQAEKDGLQGLAAEQTEASAKMGAEKDKTKELKFKTEADEGREAQKDADKKIEKENQEAIKKEKEAEDMNKEQEKVSPDQAVYHLKHKTPTVTRM